MSENKIKGFKKFSEIRNKKENKDVGSLPIKPLDDSDMPMLPNLPSDKSKTQSNMKDKTIYPPKEKKYNKKSDVNEKVDFYGKLAKFPKKTKASKALNFLENIKISKNSIWYLLIEKQDNELQMVKYNNKQGFDMEKFVLELKGYYIKKWYKTNPKLTKLIESIEVGGAKEFSTIKNIPNIEVDGKKLISKITEDIIRLLSK
jgi:hypothetical protein